MADVICGNCFKDLSQGTLKCPYCGYDTTPDRENYGMALPVGTILNGRYITGKVLGQGGFGITYMAQEHKTGKKVAIKEFFPDSIATRSDQTTVSAYGGQRRENFEYGLSCFLEEAKTLSQFIGHPSIVGVYSFFEENGTAYLTMEYIDGISLQTHLQEKGKLNWEETQKLLFPIMDALAAVHSKGIIHRDIAPDNIFLLKDGTVKLLDFGAARYSMGDKSRSLDVVLKHGYAPMEQYTRRSRQGPFTDVYAMAATIYHCITGHPPPEAAERVDEDLLAMPSAYGARLPAEAEDAILKALSVRASGRYQSMDAFKQDLLLPEATLESKTASNPAPRKKKSKLPFVIAAILATILATLLFVIPREKNQISASVPETTEPGTAAPETTAPVITEPEPFETESLPVVTEETASQSVFGYVNASEIRIRSGPSFNSESVGTYTEGTVVEIYFTEGNWGKTDLGWVCLDYITIT